MNGLTFGGMLVQYRIVANPITLSTPLHKYGYVCGSANVAQLVEQLIRNEQVVGSIPTVGSSLQSAFFLDGTTYSIII